MSPNQPHQPVRIPKQGNPNWPLPVDYFQRDSEYQRVARVNAACMWRMPGATVEEAVRSWSWFREYYLCPDAEAGFDPGFYDSATPLPPATMHYHMVGWLHQFDFLAIGAPRQSAKSTTKRSIFVHRLTTGHRYKINSIVPKEDFGIKEVQYVRTQLERNQRILADFGELRDTKGSGIWNNHQLVLTNGCEFQILSVDGKIRGTRGHLNCVDDPEFDEDYRSRSAAVVGRLKEMLLKVVIPMGGHGSKLMWLGTMVSKQALLYHIVATDNDPRFRSIQQGGLWFKVNIPAFDAQGNNAWPALYTDAFLQQKRAVMGESFFRTEYMGDPRSEEDSPFTVVPDAHEWWLEGAHYLKEPIDPWSSGAQLHYKEAGHSLTEADRTARVVPLADHMAGMTRILTVDYAEGLTSAHDYSAIVVGGLDKRNDLWVWDAWQGRVRSLALAEQIWKLAKKYRVHIIAVESVATQIEVFRLVRDYIANQRLPEGWAPQVLPLKYPAHLSKADRIAALEWRFTTAKIKLPRSTDLIGPHNQGLRVLHEQIRNFTPDLRGLPTDDLVDALAMMQYVVRGAVRSVVMVPTALSVADRLERGEVYLPGTRIHIATTVRPESLPLEDVERIMRANYRRMEQQNAGEEPDDPAPAWLLDATTATGAHLGEILL